MGTAYEKNIGTVVTTANGHSSRTGTERADVTNKEKSVLADVTPGTAAAGKALVLDSSGNIDSVSGIVADTVEVVGSGGSSQSDVSAPLVVAQASGHPHAELYRASADVTEARLYLSKARGVADSPAVVSNGDELGTVVFRGYDGSSFLSGAAIVAEVNATPGASDMPTRLIFQTAADGASFPSGRWYIDHAGAMLPWAGSTYPVGSASKPVSAVYTDAINFGDEDLDTYDEGTWTPTLGFATAGDESWTLDVQSGAYTRIGRLVIASCRVRASAMSYTTASGVLKVKGLPFTVANAPHTMMGPVHLSYVANNYPGLAAKANATETTFGIDYADVTGIGNISTAQITTGETPEVRATCIYYV